MKRQHWLNTPEVIARQIKSHLYVTINHVQEDNRPCSYCSKLGTSVEFLLSNDGPEPNSTNAMVHLGSVCWKKVRAFLDAKGVPE